MSNLSSPHHRPKIDDPAIWRTYWKAHKQPWRTEPEIDEERQKLLDELRAITPNMEQGIYPFKDIKLTRADIEWLVATRLAECEPANWNNVDQWEVDGLDLR